MSTKSGQLQVGGTLPFGRPSVRRRKPPAVSDGLRLVVLERYGGIYFDLDTLFLKDLRPLGEVEFIYQWSNQPFGTNAISCFRRGSPALRALCERGARLGSCHPAVLLRFDELQAVPGEVVVFPCFLFDPVWIAQDTGVAVNGYCNRFDDFFTKTVPITLAEFFPGAYAFSWHNRWSTPIRPGHLADRVRAEVHAAVSARYPCRPAPVSPPAPSGTRPDRRSGPAGGGP